MLVVLKYMIAGAQIAHANAARVAVLERFDVRHLVLVMHLAGRDIMRTRLRELTRPDWLVAAAVVGNRRLRCSFRVLGCGAAEQVLN